LFWLIALVTLTTRLFTTSSENANLQSSASTYTLPLPFLVDLLSV
jgi:hypothetical protein